MYLEASHKSASLRVHSFSSDNTSLLVEVIFSNYSKNSLCFTGVVFKGVVINNIQVWFISLGDVEAELVLFHCCSNFLVGIVSYETSTSHP